MRQHFKLSAVQQDKPLDADLVDMPPYDDVWANRRYVHDTISGEPQTSLNGRPRNIPRNAELMTPLDTPLWRRRRTPRRRRGDYDGSFPWRAMQYRDQPSSSTMESMVDSIQQVLTRGDNMDMMIQLLLLLNVALILYIILRLTRQ